MQAPSPQRPSPLPASFPRRTFSLPARPSRSLPAKSAHSSSGGLSSFNSGDGSENIEVLYAYSNARIVNFSIPLSAGPDGKLPGWRSPSERTIASGPLRIYKTIPHNIAFLQSGSALRPILSKTRCWNVDGRDNFCLQLRPGNYWRIEILRVEDGELAKATEFGEALRKIAAYEITACPFDRSGVCGPVVESPEALLPTKVWRRLSVRRRPSREIVLLPTEEVVEEREEENKKPEDMVKDDIPVEHNFKLEPKLQTPLVPVAVQETQADTECIARDTIQPGYLSSDNRLVVYERPIKTTDIVTGEDEECSTLGSNDTADGKEVAKEWPELPRPESSTLPAKRRSLNITPPTILSPKITETTAHGSISRSPSRSPTRPPQRSVTPDPADSQSSAEQTKWYTPAEGRSDMRLHKRRNRRSQTISEVTNTCIGAYPVSDDTDASTALSTPTLWSGTDSSSDEEEILKTPPRPSTRVVRDTHISKPPLQTTASSVVLAKTVGLVGRTASLVVFKPSSYLVALMFSIAARIVTRAVTGAAYTLTEREAMGWEGVEDANDWEDGFGTPFSRGRTESRSGSSGGGNWAREDWGLEE